jgi:hypothetical protein
MVIFLMYVSHIGNNQTIYSILRPLSNGYICLIRKQPCRPSKRRDGELFFYLRLSGIIKTECKQSERLFTIRFILKHSFHTIR